TGSIVKDLARNGVEVETGLESSDSAEFQGHEVEKESTVSLGSQTDKFATGLGSRGIEYVLQVGRFATEAWAVVNDLAVNLSRSVINKGHGRVRSAEKAVDILVCDLGKWRIQVVVIAVGDFIKHGRKLVRNLFTAELYQPQA